MTSGRGHIGCTCGKGAPSPAAISIADITPAFIEWFYEAAIDGWYEDGPIDWEEALSRAENTDHDFGETMLSPAILKLQREVRRLRRENGIA